MDFRHVSDDGYVPSKEAMQRFDDYLLKMGYYTNTRDGVIINDGHHGNMRVYAVVARFSSEEFERQFERIRRITLGNMCEVDIVEKTK